jgi:hypothetical protein
VSKLTHVSLNIKHPRQDVRSPAYVIRFGPLTQERAREIYNMLDNAAQAHTVLVAHYADADEELLRELDILKPKSGA